MILLLQALLIIALIPLLEIQADLSARVSLLSRIDESLAEKNENLAHACSRIQELNHELGSLEAECLAAAKSPAVTAPLKLRAESIVAEQALISWEMQALVSTPHDLIRGIWTSPIRDASKPCLLSGELHWPGSVIAEFSAESGGASTSEQRVCEWKYNDPRVRPL